MGWWRWGSGKGQPAPAGWVSATGQASYEINSIMSLITAYVKANE